jgi:SPW repeat
MTGLTRREATLDIYNLVLGGFLLLSPWLLAFTNETARIDIWVTSAGIVLFSGAAVIVFAEWEEWINLVLGAWLIVSPWLLGFTHTAAMHWSIGIGAAVLFVTALEVWLIHYDQPEHQT